MADSFSITPINMNFVPTSSIELVDSLEQSLNFRSSAHHPTLTYLLFFVEPMPPDRPVPFHRRVLDKVATDASNYLQLVAQDSSASLDKYVNPLKHFVDTTAAEMGITLKGKKPSTRSYKGFLLACTNLLYNKLYREDALKACIDMDTFKASLRHLPEFECLEDKQQWKTLLSYRNYLSTSLHLVDKNAHLLMLAESAVLLVGEVRCVQGSTLGVEVQRYVTVRDELIPSVKRIASAPKAAPMRKPKGKKQRVVHHYDSSEDDSSVNTVHAWPARLVRQIGRAQLQVPTAAQSLPADNSWEFDGTNTPTDDEMLSQQQQQPVEQMELEERTVSTCSWEEAMQHCQFWEQSGTMKPGSLKLEISASFRPSAAVPPPPAVCPPTPTMNELSYQMGNHGFHRQAQVPVRYAPQQQQRDFSTYANDSDSEDDESYGPRSAGKRTAVQQQLPVDSGSKRVRAELLLQLGLSNEFGYRGEFTTSVVDVLANL